MSTPTSHVTYPQTAAAPQLLCDLRVQHSPAYLSPISQLNGHLLQEALPDLPQASGFPMSHRGLTLSPPWAGAGEVAVHKDQMGSGPQPLLCRWLEKWLKVTELKQKLTNKRLKPPTETDQKISGGDLDFGFSPGQMSTPHFTHKQHPTPRNPHSPVSQNLQSGSSRQSKPRPHPAHPAAFSPGALHTTGQAPGNPQASAVDSGPWPASAQREGSWGSLRNRQFERLI